METYSLVSVGSFAREAAVSPAVRRWVDSGQIAAIRIAGGYRLIERAEADRFLQRRAEGWEQRAGR